MELAVRECPQDVVLGTEPSDDHGHIPSVSGGDAGVSTVRDRITLPPQGESRMFGDIRVTAIPVVGGKPFYVLSLS